MNADSTVGITRRPQYQRLTQACIYLGSLSLKNFPGEVFCLCYFSQEFLEGGHSGDLHVLLFYHTGVSVSSSVQGQYAAHRVVVMLNELMPASV